MAEKKQGGWKARLEQLEESPKGAALVQFIKFGAVGVSSTAITYAVKNLCYYVLFANLGWSENTKMLAANLLAFVISVTNSYYWNNRFVFSKGIRKTRKEHLLSYGKTVLCYAGTGLALAPAMEIWLTSAGMPYWLAALGTLVVTIPINFLLNKFWAFRQKKPGA